MVVEKMSVRAKMALLAWLTVGSASLAYAQLPEAKLSEPILGINLGQPSQFKQCGDKRLHWCFVRAPVGSEDYQSVILHPPESDSPAALPDWVRSDKLLLDLDRKKIAQKFFVKTWGLSVQDQVVSAMTQRFGKPLVFELIPMKSAAGATAAIQYAKWMTPEAVVEHNCVGLHSCTLRFFTPAAYAKLPSEELYKPKTRYKL